MIEGTQPLMMQFLRYITYEKSSIPDNFLLPLERKLILFNENRQRQLKDDRDKSLLVGTFRSLVRKFLELLTARLRT